jgi:hypothetical protein
MDNSTMKQSSLLKIVSDYITKKFPRIGFGLLLSLQMAFSIFHFSPKMQNSCCRLQLLKPETFFKKIFTKFNQLFTILKITR